MPPWWKSALKTLKEAGKDFQTVAREASKEWTMPTRKLADLKTCRSTAVAVEYFQQQPQDGLAEVMAAIMSNEVLRLSLASSFPIIESEAGAVVPSEDQLLAQEFYRFFHRHCRFDPSVWKDYVAAALKTGKCNGKYFQVVARDVHEEKLNNECLSLVRHLRESKTSKHFHGLLTTAVLSKAVHSNLVASERIREGWSRDTHTALAEEISDCQVAIPQLETEVTRLTEELETLETTKLEISVSPETKQTIDDTETEIKQLIEASNKKQQELTVLTGKISAVREEKLKLEAAINQLKRQQEHSERELKLLMEHHTSIASQEISTTEQTISDLVSRIDLQVSHTPNYKDKAVAACTTFLTFKENFLREALDTIKTFGAVTEETTEAVVNEVLATFRQAERHFAEIMEFHKKFESVVLTEEDLKRAEMLFEELNHFSEPFKLRFGEFAVLRNLEVLPVSPSSAPLTSSPSSPPPALASIAAPSIPRKDSFEDLLGIYACFVPLSVLTSKAGTFRLLLSERLRKRNQRWEVFKLLFYNDGIQTLQPQSSRLFRRRRRNSILSVGRPIAVLCDWRIVSQSQRSLVLECLRSMTPC